jgi:hypothetical protein
MVRFSVSGRFPGWLLACVLAAASGCNDNEKVGGAGDVGGQPSHTVVDRDGVVRVEPARESAAAPAATPPLGMRAGGASAVESPQWAIVLSTTTGEGHVQSAHRAREFLAAQAPELSRAWVHSTDSGSMVLYGRYRSPDDRLAQSDLKRIKELEINGRRPLAMAILGPVEAGAVAGAALHPHDLRNLRKRYPKVNPLYTLQVALWGVDEQHSLADVQRRAEAYAAELRSRGVEAWFFHSAEQQMSVVTVGVFDHTAITPGSGFYSPAVQHLQEQFPRHLINGQEVILRDPNAPGGQKVQECQLVNVPGP